MPRCCCITSCRWGNCCISLYFRDRDNSTLSIKWFEYKFNLQRERECVYSQSVLLSRFWRYHLNRALTQFSNPSRKDFVALFIHHWATLLLMTCSFMSGKLRTGCITLALHEYSDIFLESGKLCNYCSYQRGADFFFGLFVISWVVFRMYCFCTKLLWQIAICGVYTCWIGDTPLVLSLVNIGFLYILQVRCTLYILRIVLCDNWLFANCNLKGIHIYWFRMILKVIQTKLGGGQVKDIRSAGESEDSTEEFPSTEKRHYDWCDPWYGVKYVCYGENNADKSLWMTVMQRSSLRLWLSTKLNVQCFVIMIHWLVI